MESNNNNLIIPPGSSVQGYFWLSNSERPVIVDGAFSGLSLLDYYNPFVIEAQLYDKATQMSYSIKYVDGQYFVQKIKVTEQIINDAKSYISKWDDNERLLFTTTWLKKQDPLCCNMGVLVPADFIFVGFKR